MIAKLICYAKRWKKVGQNKKNKNRDIFKQKISSETHQFMQNSKKNFESETFFFMLVLKKKENWNVKNIFSQRRTSAKCWEKIVEEKDDRITSTTIEILDFLARIFNEPLKEVTFLSKTWRSLIGIYDSFDQETSCWIFIKELHVHKLEIKWQRFFVHKKRLKQKREKFQLSKNNV